MQLALSADVVAPLGAGAVALIVAMVAALARARRPDRPDPADPSAAGEVRRRTVGEAVAARGAAFPSQLDAPLSPAESAPVSVDLPGTGTESGLDMGAAPRMTHRADARDRLLAVLLDDPVRAVGAAVELDRCRGRLDRLSDALHHQHVVLGGILRRLSDVGLRPEQLARLAGLPIDEVLGLLLEPAEAHRRR